MAGDRAEKRERILEAAIQTFARKGFHQSRVSDIASEAGVADGTIYLYFRNKDDVLISIFEEKMGLLVERVKAQVEAVSDPQEKLISFIDFHFHQVERERSLAEIFQVELRLSSKFMKEYVPVHLGEYLEVLASIVELGQGCGVFRKDVKPHVVKRVIFGAIDELALNWVLTRGKRYDLSRNTPEIAGLFLRGLLVDPSSMVVQTKQSA